MARLISVGTFAAFVGCGEFLLAEPVSVSMPGEAMHADTEISTNVAFAADTSRLAALRLTLDCNATETNSLEVLIGHDADGDGLLSLDEADLVFGCDCGMWFMRDAEGFEEDFGSAAIGRTERELTIPMRGPATDWNLVRVTRHGSLEVDESIVIDATRRRFYIRLQ